MALLIDESIIKTKQRLNLNMPILKDYIPYSYKNILTPLQEIASSTDDSSYISIEFGSDTDPSIIMDVQDNSNSSRKIYDERACEIKELYRISEALSTSTEELVISIVLDADISFSNMHTKPITANMIEAVYRGQKCFQIFQSHLSKIVFHANFDIPAMHRSLVDSEVKTITTLCITSVDLLSAVSNLLNLGGQFQYFYNNIQMISEACDKALLLQTTPEQLLLIIYHNLLSQDI